MEDPFHRFLLSHFGEKIYIGIFKYWTTNMVIDTFFLNGSTKLKPEKFSELVASRPLDTVIFDWVEIQKVAGCKIYI